MLRVTDDAEPITTVWLVPHTHWDREWYEPFQRFRLRLVDLMDDVVDRALAEPEFRFTMDGQMASDRSGPRRFVAWSPMVSWRSAPGGSSWTSSSARARP